MTRARAPRPHEVEAARFDPRLVRAFAERSADDGWRTRGVCSRQDPDTFFPPPREAADAALALCRGCAVLGSCLAWALDAGDRYGVWGGATPRERRAMSVVWHETYGRAEMASAAASGQVLADH
jgi:WhiB family transcriptional regulator, redox-sensing transcriptional regulator